ncbi:MAG: hypothetical protein AABX64_01610 [Nanoarchaeota archaeon]
MAEYKPIDELYKVDFRDLDVFSIDVLTDVPIIKNPIYPTQRFEIIHREYEIIHRLPHLGAPNGRIFLMSFDSGSDQFGDEGYPCYRKLVEFISEITHGVMESRDHVRNLAIRPGSAITPGRVLDWIREYKLNDDVDVIKTLFGRIRLNE